MSRVVGLSTPSQLATRPAYFRGGALSSRCTLASGSIFSHTPMRCGRMTYAPAERPGRRWAEGGNRRSIRVLRPGSMAEVVFSVTTPGSHCCCLRKFTSLLPTPLYTRSALQPIAIQPLLSIIHACDSHGRRIGGRQNTQRKYRLQHQLSQTESAR